MPLAYTRMLPPNDHETYSNLKFDPASIKSLPYLASHPSQEALHFLEEWQKENAVEVDRSFLVRTHLEKLMVKVAESAQSVSRFPMHDIRPPAEILTLICEHLHRPSPPHIHSHGHTTTKRDRPQPYGHALQDLSRFTLSCRRIHKFTTPVLYREVPEHWRLAETLTLRPKLLKYVEVLHRRGFNWPAEPFSNLKHIICEEEVEVSALPGRIEKCSIMKAQDLPREVLDRFTWLRSLHFTATEPEHFDQYGVLVQKCRVKELSIRAEGFSPWSVLVQALQVAKDVVTSLSLESDCVASDGIDVTVDDSIREQNLGKNIKVLRLKRVSLLDVKDMNADGTVHQTHIDPTPTPEPSLIQVIALKMLFALKKCTRVEVEGVVKFDTGAFMFMPENMKVFDWDLTDLNYYPMWREHQPHDAAPAYFHSEYLSRNLHFAIDWAGEFRQRNLKEIRAVGWEGKHGKYLDRILRTMMERRRVPGVRTDWVEGTANARLTLYWRPIGEYPLPEQGKQPWTGILPQNYHPPEWLQKWPYEGMAVVREIFEFPLAATIIANRKAKSQANYNRMIAGWAVQDATREAALEAAAAAMGVSIEAFTAPDLGLRAQAREPQLTIEEQREAERWKETDIPGWLEGGWRPLLIAEKALKECADRIAKRENEEKEAAEKALIKRQKEERAAQRAAKKQARREKLQAEARAKSEAAKVAPRLHNTGRPRRAVASTSTARRPPLNVLVASVNRSSSSMAKRKADEDSNPELDPVSPTSSGSRKRFKGEGKALEENAPSAHLSRSPSPIPSTVFATVTLPQFRRENAPLRDGHSSWEDNERYPQLNADGYEPLWEVGNSRPVDYDSSDTDYESDRVAASPFPPEIDSESDWDSGSSEESDSSESDPSDSDPSLESEASDDSDSDMGADQDYHADGERDEPDYPQPSRAVNASVSSTYPSSSNGEGAAPPNGDSSLSLSMPVLPNPPGPRILPLLAFSQHATSPSPPPLYRSTPLSRPVGSYRSYADSSRQPYEPEPIYYPEPRSFYPPSPERNSQPYGCEYPVHASPRYPPSPQESWRASSQMPYAQSDHYPEHPPVPHTYVQPSRYGQAAYNEVQRPPYWHSEAASNVGTVDYYQPRSPITSASLAAELPRPDAPYFVSPEMPSGPLPAARYNHFEEPRRFSNRLPARFQPSSVDGDSMMQEGEQGSAASASYALPPARDRIRGSVVDVLDGNAGRQFRPHTRRRD